MNELLSSFRSLGYIDNSNEKIVLIGLQRIRALVYDILLALICAAIMGNMAAGFLFEAIYIPLRIYAGGFHCSSEKRCRILSYGSTILCMAFIFYLPLCIIRQNLLMVLSVALVIICSPTESANRPLSKRERQVFRNRSIMIVLAEMAAYCLFIFWGIWIYAKTIYAAVALVTIGLICARFSDRCRTLLKL